MPSDEALKCADAQADYLAKASQQHGGTATLILPQVWIEGMAEIIDRHYPPQPQPQAGDTCADCHDEWYCARCKTVGLRDGTCTHCACTDVVVWLTRRVRKCAPCAGLAGRLRDAEAELAEFRATVISFADTTQKQRERIAQLERATGCIVPLQNERNEARRKVEELERDLAEREHYLAEAKAEAKENYEAFQVENEAHAKEIFRNQELERENDALKAAPLCAAHAEVWFCERTGIKTKSGCVFCDLLHQNAELQRNLEMAQEVGAALKRRIQERLPCTHPAACRVERRVVNVGCHSMMTSDYRELPDRRHRNDGPPCAWCLKVEGLRKALGWALNHLEKLVGIHEDGSAYPRGGRYELCGFGPKLEQARLAMERAAKGGEQS